MSPAKSDKPTAEQKVEAKLSIVQANAGTVATTKRIVRFRNRPMVMMDLPFPHFRPLHKEMFDRIAYPILGGVSRSRMSDVFAYLGNTAEDLSYYEDHILFGLEDPSDGTYADAGYYHADAQTRVWDMQRLEWVEVEPSQAVWRSPYGVIPATKPVPFIMSLAGGDQGLYDDILQSLAPLVMSKKPDGVIWWVGDGANGKSTLMDALYKIFPNQLSSITVKRLVDGRDTPGLNGTLANIVKESSEGRIDDTEIYKAIGTHENFRVHKFHSQDDLEVRGNLHHIFSANTIPTFNDKGHSARRRTFIVPFTQTFDSDPTFEERTFTPLMFGQLIAEMCRYAVRLREQGYRYKWSGTTLSAKADYDSEANNAEEYANHIIQQGVVGFDSFNPVRMDYENWCADEGYVPLGITNLRRALGNKGFERMSIRSGESTRKMYRLPVVSSPGELEPMGLGRPGMYTITGFTRPPEHVEPPEFDDPEPVEEDEPTKQPTILKGRW